MLPGLEFSKALTFTLAPWDRIWLLESPRAGGMSSYHWNLPGSLSWVGHRVHPTHASAYTHAPQSIPTSFIQLLLHSHAHPPTPDIPVLPDPLHATYNVQIPFTFPNPTYSFIHLMAHRWWVLCARHSPRYLSIIWPQKLTYASVSPHRLYMQVFAHPLYI